MEQLFFTEVLMQKHGYGTSWVHNAYVHRFTIHSNVHKFTTKVEMSKCTHKETLQDKKKDGLVRKCVGAGLRLLTMARRMGSLPKASRPTWWHHCWHSSLLKKHGWKNHATKKQYLPIDIRWLWMETVSRLAHAAAKPGNMGNVSAHAQKEQIVYWVSWLFFLAREVLWVC